jgi:hypothetical protein
MSEESKLTEKLKEKENGTKFSEEEMKVVTELRDKYNEVQFRLGQTKISQIRFRHRCFSSNKI